MTAHQPAHSGRHPRKTHPPGTVAWAVADPLRAVLAVIAVITVLTGAVQVPFGGPVLQLIGADSTPETRQLFGTVGMFMVVVGGLLLHTLLDAVPPRSGAVVRAPESRRVRGRGIGVLNGVFAPVALLVALLRPRDAGFSSSFIGAVSAPHVQPPGWQDETHGKALPGPRRWRHAGGLAGRSGEGAHRGGPGIPARRRHLRRDPHGRHDSLRGLAGGDVPGGRASTSRTSAQHCPWATTSRVRGRCPPLATPTASSARSSRPLGINDATIRARAAEPDAVEGSFNVVEFTEKRCHAIDATRHRRRTHGGRHVASHLPDAPAPGRENLDGRRLGQGRQRGRSPAARGRRSVAGLVHRKHAATGATGRWNSTST